MRKQVRACHGHCVGTKEERCVIEGLRLKATFVLVIYFFSEENNTMRKTLCGKLGVVLHSDENKHASNEVAVKLI